MIIALSDRRGGLFGYAARMQEAIGSECSLSFIDRKSTFSGDPVFLQYSGYGFARKGAPLWLLDSLRRDRSKYGLLGIFFHELYAVKPPWSTAFWLSPVQMYVAKELVRLCDYWMTSCTKYGKWLSRHSVEKPNAVIPIYSNIGEPTASRVDRRPEVIVFGTPAVRLATYRAAGHTLLEWVRRENLQLLDIGDEIQDSEMARISRSSNIQVLGRQSEARVSELLARARFGVLKYDSSRLAKSGVFAAYSSHGLTPIVISPKVYSEDGLSPGKHYLERIPLTGLAESHIAEIAHSAYAWYRTHTVAHHVRTVRKLVDAVRKSES